MDGHDALRDLAPTAALEVNCSDTLIFPTYHNRTPQNTTTTPTLPIHNCIYYHTGYSLVELHRVAGWSIERLQV